MFVSSINYHFLCLCLKLFLYRNPLGMVDMSEAAGTSQRDEGRAVMVIQLYHVQLLFVGKKPFCASESQQSLTPKDTKLMSCGSHSSGTWTLALHRRALPPLALFSSLWAWRQLVISVCASCVQRANLGRIGAGRLWGHLGIRAGHRRCFPLV